jgi:hypothetical protein
MKLIYATAVALLGTCLVATPVLAKVDGCGTNRDKQCTLVIYAVSQDPHNDTNKPVANGSTLAMVAGYSTSAECEDAGKVASLASTPLHQFEVWHACIASP